jgi:nucleoside 2-deoxyribosyltransferase
MFPFHFQNFIGTLDIQYPNYDGIPNDSPVFIYYKEDTDLTKHEILKRFYKLLQVDNITYLRPAENLTGEWIFNLQEFRHNFECLKEVDYLQGSITIEPEYFRKINDYKNNEERSTEETSIRISVYKEDLNLLKSNQLVINDELSLSLEKFRKNYPVTEKYGFLMMKFEDSRIQKEIIDVLKSHLLEKGIKLLRADDKWIADDLFDNIKTYMQGCSFGIALFDRINTDEFNPNVSLEIGYMMALNKPVLLLKDKTLKSLQTDLVGRLYHQFDFQNPEKTIPLVLDKWISDKEI